MRIPCPHCGERDLSEFTYGGDAEKALQDVPSGESAEQAVERVYVRSNPAGVQRELWFHEFGCHSWIVIARSTLTHEITAGAAS